jgi:hypothetical protein
MSGMKLVPVEPTENMVVEGFESWPDPHFSKPEEWDACEKMSGCQQAAHRAKLCYAAMLAAAPVAPQAVLIDEQIMLIADRYSDVDRAGYIRFNEDDLINFARALLEASGAG